MHTLPDAVVRVVSHGVPPPPYCCTRPHHLPSNQVRTLSTRGTVVVDDARRTTRHYRFLVFALSNTLLCVVILDLFTLLSSAVLSSRDSHVRPASICADTLEHGAHRAVHLWANLTDARRFHDRVDNARRAPDNTSWEFLLA